MTIVETETREQQLLLSQGIDFVINIIHNNNETYRSLVDTPNSKLFMVHIDQLFVFKQWHHATFTMVTTTTEIDILYNLAEEESDRFCNS